MSEGAVDAVGPAVGVTTQAAVLDCGGRVPLAHRQTVAEKDERAARNQFRKRADEPRFSLQLIRRRLHVRPGARPPGFIGAAEGVP